CRECQEKVLLALDVSSPGAEAMDHLGQCGVCRQYQARLVRLEANVPRVPVPPSTGASRVGDLLLEKATLVPAEDIGASNVRHFWMFWAKTCMAACLLLVLLTAFLVRGHRPGVPDKPVVEAP